jgi:hypothetical protein
MQTAAVEKRQPFFRIRAEKRKMPDFFAENACNAAEFMVL